MWRSSIALAAFALFAAVCDSAKAQCVVSNSSVSVTNGTSCAIAPNTTLTGNVPVAGNPVVYATNPNSQITTNNVTISPNNGGTTGALATNSGVITLSSGSNIKGNWSTGASAQTGGQIIFLPGSMISPPFGGGVTALSASGAGSQITATGLTANLNGNGGNTGASATGGGTIMLNTGTAITFAAGGGGNTGLSASGAGSTITTSGVTLSMPGGGGNDTGVSAASGAAISLNNTTVSMPGNGGGETGLSANGATITGSNTTISVSSNGGNARGGLLQNNGAISLTGGSVTTAGNSQSYGFLFSAGTTALNLNGTTVTSAADAFAVQGGTATINTSNGATVTGNPYSGNAGILLSVTGGATTTMTSDNSTLTGAITTAGGSTSNVTFQNGTLWNMTATSNATNVTNNGSEINVIAPTASNSYKTLTVMNYTGTGGNITLNTYLGADSSPSDQLVIQNGGTATGSTTLTIHNTTGPGEQTTANGILVVNALGSATTAPGAFALAGEVRAGAYDYFLFRGGINGNAPQDWFLRSTFFEPPGPEPEPEPEPPPVLPPDPPPGPDPPGLDPIIGPELATYGVVQPLARQLGVTTLGTLNQRIGDTMTLANAGSFDGWPARSEWGRFFGQQIDNRYQAFADPRATGWLAGFQGGIDLWRSYSPSGHRDAAGIYFAYSQANAGVDGLITNSTATAFVQTHTGLVNLDAFSTGAYWTHYGPSGWYLDAVAQATLYAGSASTQYAALPIDGSGFIGSLEGGYPVKLPFLGPNFVLEPQGQIIWQQVSFASANDGEGLVELGTTSGVTGRLGVRGQWTIPGRDGALWQPYTGVNFWRDWGGKETTLFGGIDQVPLDEQATRTEVLVGLTAKLSPALSLYGEGDYQFVASQGNPYVRNGVKGDIGFRYTW